mmetsp:Transcript_37350/g.89306  ORF Transcript_37350/g.89306 Transcript_37350/m.89306 type:complete len:235 (-) Transcript_37350:140-844(-)
MKVRFGLVCSVCSLLYSGQGTSIRSERRSQLKDAGTGVWQSVKEMWSWMTSNGEISLEFFVMSKCPDARTCEQTFLPVLKDLAPLVRTKFTYIGKDEGTEVSCMHGADECAGNMQRLCAQKAELKQLAAFALCQDQDQSAIPGSGEACATQAGIAAQDLQKCVADTGEELLKASVRRAAGLSVSTSCTLQVAEETFCVHDGDWTNCNCGPDKAECLKQKVCELSTHHRKGEFCS